MEVVDAALVLEREIPCQERGEELEAEDARHGREAAQGKSGHRRHGHVSHRADGHSTGQAAVL